MARWQFVGPLLGLYLILAYPAQGFMVCPPGICQSIDCSTLETSNCAESNGETVPHASFCGCCPVCVHYLAEGESCASMQLLLLGVSQPVIQCRPGLICHPQKLICIPAADG